MEPISVSISPASSSTPLVKLTYKNNSPTCKEILGAAFVKGEVPRDQFLVKNTASDRKALYTEPELQIPPQYVRIEPRASQEALVPLHNFYSLEPGKNQVEYFTEIGYRDCENHSQMGSYYAKSNIIDIKV